MIYILEDDDSIRDVVTYTLNAQGLESRGFARPSEFWQAMEKPPELLLLDIMLPEEDGLHILKRLRGAAATKALPVILLTAKAAEYDKVLGLDSGADDYIAKPFGMMELASRVKALLRRTAREEKEYRRGALCICPAKHTVTVEGQSVALTLKEYQLLCLLAENPGVVFSRTQLLDRVWGYAFEGESRTVDVHVMTLRQKLGACGSCIETVRGLGYRMGEETL